MEIVPSLLKKVGIVSRPQVKVLTMLFATIVIACGKVNFTNLSRYSPLSEKTYRRSFAKPFNDAAFNAGVIQAATTAASTLIAVMDASFIAKSGKKTFGLDLFYNGSHSRVEKGLEVSLVGVVDVESEVGYALLAEQTFDQAAFPTLTRMDYYLDHLETARPHLPPQVQYLAVDGAYAKQAFVTGAVALNLHVIRKLRRDANLRFIFEGEQKSRGARRKYDGKVDFADLSRFTWVTQLQPGVDLYTQRVWHYSLKRPIRLAVVQDTRKPDKTGTIILFSTDLTQSAQQIYRFYKLRFQIEFLFRDAKQFTGLSDCQSCQSHKLDFHFNASFTALNLAKLEVHQQQLNHQPFVFSMASVKRRALNDPLLDTFISKLGLSPTAIKAHPNYQNLRSYGVIAA